MKRMTPQEYQYLVDSCQVLEKDSYGEKVLRCSDGKIVKIFRLKRFFSSALIYPYARRFSRNALKLHALEIPTIHVVRTAHCPQPSRDLVWYQPVEGRTLRDQARDQLLPNLIEDLGAFIAGLHQHGVLFRSLHWGNIIVQPDDTFALIDIADLKCYRRALSSSQRQRNFFHFLRCAEDRNCLLERIDLFCQGYAAVSGMSEKTCRQWLLAVADRIGKGSC